jgi:multiple sugar transport system ATP-binding protein
MADVTFDNVTKVFDESSVAVDRLDLEIRDREFMVIVGPSGCGKTTALRMLAGLESVSEGEIRIDGQPVTDVPPERRDIAMVFQSYALYPHMTVAQNLGFGLRMRHEKKALVAERVQEAARILGIEELLARKPRQLSGGQRQRVALGRAIVRHPRVFLLDEPLSNLDAELRAQTRVELMKLHERLNGTFVYVTHDQVEAMTMGTRIAVMRSGALQQLATPRDIYSDPANMYVAGFVGSPKISFTAGTADGRVVTAPAFRLVLPAASPVRDVTLGIRPEHFSTAPREDLIEVDFDVDLVEILGADQILYGRVAGAPMTARVDPSLVVASGEKARLFVDPQKILLFDTTTERAIPSR